MRTHHRILAVALVVATVLAGCSSKKDSIMAQVARDEQSTTTAAPAPDAWPRTVQGMEGWRKWYLAQIASLTNTGAPGGTCEDDARKSFVRSLAARVEAMLKAPPAPFADIQTAMEETVSQTLRGLNLCADYQGGSSGLAQFQQDVSGAQTEASDGQAKMFQIWRKHYDVLRQEAGIPLDTPIPGG